MNGKPQWWREEQRRRRIVAKRRKMMKVALIVSGMIIGIPILVIIGLGIYSKLHPGWNPFL